jgi:phosphonoacetaldehyde hydrolase
MQDQDQGVEAVIFDWAGTTVDFGSRAPVRAFVETFARFGLELTDEEARGPMGTSKREHLQRMLLMPTVRARFVEAKGRGPEERDVDALYAIFDGVQKDLLRRSCELIPGTVESVRILRERGIRIGATTGYTRDMVAIAQEHARMQGYEPDCSVTSSDVRVGRPFPAMCLEAAMRLDIRRVAAAVKVDDTPTGILEGRNAGMWTVGVTVSGNEVGLALESWNALPTCERSARRRRAERVLLDVGAHYVIDDVGQLLPCLEDVERRIRSGERP